MKELMKQMAKPVADEASYIYRVINILNLSLNTKNNFFSFYIFYKTLYFSEFFITLNLPK